MTRKGKSALPIRLSRAAEARFWDQHDFADFWAQTEHVDVKVAHAFTQRVRAASRKQMIALRLAEWQIAEAKRISKELDVPYQTLLRRWISRGILAQRRLKRAH